MFCTAIGTVFEYNFYSFIAGVVLTTITFSYFLIKRKRADKV